MLINDSITKINHQSILKINVNHCIIGTFCSKRMASSDILYNRILLLVNDRTTDWFSSSNVLRAGIPFRHITPRPAPPMYSSVVYLTGAGGPTIVIAQSTPRKHRA